MSAKQLDFLAYKVIELSARINFVKDEPDARRIMQASFDARRVEASDDKSSLMLLLRATLNFLRLDDGGQPQSEPEVTAVCSYLIEAKDDCYDQKALVQQIWPYMRGSLVAQIGALGLDLSSTMPFDFDPSELNAN